MAAVADNPSSNFLDVPRLLESSRVRPRNGWLWYGLLLMMVALTVGTFSAGAPEGAGLGELMSGMLMLALVAGLGLMVWTSVQRVRQEQAAINALEELVQLRRWAEAAMLLEQMLSRPARTAQARAVALLHLERVLARYHRYAESMLVCEHLLESGEMDPETSMVLRLDRAMCLLHEDRLFDTDRAIKELRASAQGPWAAALVLIEIYRDVKTGHPQEAIELFQEQLPQLRRHLGYRLGDAYALVARAHDLVGQTREAADAYEKATLLAPPAELGRRYPEVGLLAERLAPAEEPAEVMA